MDLIEARMNYMNARDKVNENYRLNITEEISDEARRDNMILVENFEKYNNLIKEKCYDVLESSTDGYELMLASLEAMIRRENKEENDYYVLDISSNVANLFVCFNEIFKQWSYEADERPIYQAFSSGQYNDQLFLDLIDILGYSIVLSELKDIDESNGFLMYYDSDIFKYDNVFDMIRELKNTIIDMKINDNDMFDGLNGFICLEVEKYWDKIGFDKYMHSIDKKINKCYEIINDSSNEERIMLYGYIYDACEDVPFIGKNFVKDFMKAIKSYDFTKGEVVYLFFDNDEYCIDDEYIYIDEDASLRSMNTTDEIVEIIEKLIKDVNQEAIETILEFEDKEI